MDTKERNETEALLRESEALLRRAQHVAKLGHWVSTVTTQPDGSATVITRYGAAAAEILGRPIEELEVSDQEFIRRFIHPDDQAAALKTNERYVSDLIDLPLSGARPAYYNSSYRILRPDGEIRSINEMVEAVLTDDGSLRYIMGTIQDVTEQMAVEIALADSRALLREIIDSVPATIAVHDLEGRYVFANAALAKFHNLPVDWFPGRALAELYDNSYLRHILEADRQVIETGQRLGFYRRDYRAPDGRVSTWLASRAPIRDATGKVKYVVSVGLDITEHRQMEAALQESEDRFRSIADSLPALIWMSDENGQCIFLNKQWSAYTGRPAAEELGRGFFESIHPDDRAKSLEVERGMLSYRGHMTDEYRLRGKDGNYRWFLDNLVPRFSADGAYLGHIGVLIDIEDRRNLEEKLRHVQRLEVVGHLAGGIAHDFNNLLTVVIGNLDLIQSNPRDTEKVTRLSANALQAAERGAELVHRMVAFSRQQTLNPIQIDLNELVARIGEMLRPSLMADIEIELKLAPESCMAVADPGQVEDSLLNLALNARDAMPDGGKLTIETANVTFDSTYVARDSELKPGSYVMMAVSDTGIGMPPAVLAQAVQPFFTTKEVGKGSGLGLSMVYGFVKQSGGHLDIYSEVGRGTTVKLYLPRAAGAAEPDAKPASRALTGGSETILVVEDDVLVRRYVVEQLGALGYRILEAGTGAAALALVAAGKRFDLLFTDVMLPGGMLGPELLEQMRDKLPGLRALFTSGYSEGHVLPRERGAGEVRLLQKPYSRQRLAAEIRAALDAKTT
jgi:PAS domain S-box-containing protein